MEKLQTIIDQFARIILVYYNDQMTNFAQKHSNKGIVLAKHSLSIEQIDLLTGKEALTNVLAPAHALASCSSFDELLEQCITDICDGIVPGDVSKSTGYPKRRGTLQAFVQAYRHFSQELEKLDTYDRSDWDVLQLSLQNTIQDIQNLQISREKQVIRVGSVFNSEPLSSLVMGYTYGSKLSALGSIVNRHIPAPLKQGLIQLDGHHNIPVEEAIEEAKAEQQQRRMRLTISEHEQRLTTIEDKTATLDDTKQFMQEMKKWQKAFTQNYGEQLKQQAEQLKLLEEQNKQQQQLIEHQKQQLLESGKKQEQARRKIEDLEYQLTEQQTTLQTNSSTITLLQAKEKELSHQFVELDSRLNSLDQLLNTLQTSLNNEGVIGQQLQTLSSGLEQLRQQLTDLSSSQKHSEATSEVELQLANLSQQAYALHFQILPVRITSLGDRLNKLEQPGDNDLEQQEVFDRLNESLSTLHSDLGVASQENDVLATVEAKLNQIEEKIVALETKTQANESTELDEKVTSSGNQVIQSPGMMTGGTPLANLLRIGKHPFLGNPFFMQKLIGFPVQQHAVQEADDDTKDTSPTHNG